MDWIMVWVLTMGNEAMMLMIRGIMMEISNAIMLALMMIAIINIS